MQAPHPTSCQSCSLRQHVLPEPQSISLGSIFQGMPLLRTMPASAARSDTRGLPPFGFGDSAGKSGSMIPRSSSDTNSRPMPASVAPVHKGFVRSSEWRWWIGSRTAAAESVRAQGQGGGSDPLPRLATKGRECSDNGSCRADRVDSVPNRLRDHDILVAGEPEKGGTHGERRRTGAGA